MINSWFTLEKCARYFDGLYRDAVLERCISFRKNELMMLFRDRKPLLVHLGAPFQYCTTVREPLSAKRESIRIFPGIENPVVESVGILPAERVIRFQFKNAGRLSLVFLSNRGNVVYEQTGETEYFKKHIQIDPEILQKGPASAYASLEEDPRFSLYWKRNIAAVLGTKDYSRILEILQRSVGGEMNGRFVLQPQKGEFDPDRFYANYRKFVSHFLQESRFRDEYKSLEGQITAELERLQRQLGTIRMEADLEQRALQYRNYADTLAACRYQIADRPDAFEIPELYRREGMPQSIPLKTDRDIAGNIDHYYALARDTEIRIAAERRRREDLRAEYARFESLYRSLKKISAYPELQDWKKAQAGQLSSAARSPENTEKRPYREFLVDGWRIWVGKSARDNEELTFKLAAKTDLWLHVRYGTGSHVILKKDGKKQVPKEILLQAAALAARFSEQKHSKLAAVVCTERKYVSRIKGAAAGKVRYQFERDIMAELASTDL
ncbi:MAG: NFACT RNA binding domain-containing protein [Candidatus Marinimicrobia bacterium]|jgi:hypothetical protein|nr:NFACT RNA binding domain-containing protein [Candidatus Neomarinimicrobiota bacterium]MDD3967084.1 NFACT RNA binding domain-containing protein [Candidatus Neomarinimicrobiota bacterium]MDX9778455.1 NFACT RNA binding domain-containing protein [bacterium]